MRAAPGGGAGVGSPEASPPAHDLLNCQRDQAAVGRAYPCDVNKQRLAASAHAVTRCDLAHCYVAALVGIARCVLNNADLLAMVDLVSPWPWAGNIITSPIIGRGANFVHDFASRWLAPGR